MQEMTQNDTQESINLSGKHVLLLQGPLGPFFADLATHLIAAGATVERVVFNRGDWHYAAGTTVTRFEGNADDWPDWLKARLGSTKISGVIGYGDSRFYHRVARTVCEEMDVPFFGLEEGYVRPGYVTFEEGGNNANSRFPEWFKQAYPDLEDGDGMEPAKIGNTFMHQLWFAVHYYLIKDWRLAGFRRYQHHRRGNWLTEVSAWMRGGLRKFLTIGPSERGLDDRLADLATDSAVFFVPLQVAVDAQMVHHSRFPSVAAFIEEVIASFAAHAPEGSVLVLKHHPMDRGFHHYDNRIQNAVRKTGVKGRVHYAFDLDIERLLKVASGCVTVNSTVGIQALEAGVPTLMLGTASANIAGLTSQLSLDDFWTAQQSVDTKKIAAFRSAMISKTQIAGSFYKDRDLAATAITGRLSKRLNGAENGLVHGHPARADCDIS